MCLLKCANVTQKPCVHTLFLRLKQKNKGVYYTFVWMSYHCFRWYATFKNKTRFQDFCQSYILSTDRIKIHQSQPASMTKRRSEGHASGCDWWISIPSVHNTQDWWKFWKRFHGRFVFQSRVSMKTNGNKNHHVSRLTCLSKCNVSSSTRNTAAECKIKNLRFAWRPARTSSFGRRKTFSLSLSTA